MDALFFAFLDRWLLEPLSLPGGYRFADPLWLLAALLVPLVLWARKKQPLPVLVVPHASAWFKASAFHRSRWPLILGAGALGLLFVALARPQKVEDKREVKSKGYDLILALDLSTSMLAEDYERNGERLNRLQAIKPVVQAFITRRPNDRIGLVVFSGLAYTLSPLTFDHAWLALQTERLKLGKIKDGTAIGDGLGVALSRLEQAERQNAGERLGAFIVLLTDGSNNSGTLTPDQAAQIAKARKIPVYTIGAGRTGIVPMPVFDQLGNKLGYERVRSDLDETSLRRIADTTGGRFYRADDITTTERAFAAIDKTQKIEFEGQSYFLTTELFAWFATPAFVLLTALGFSLSRPLNRRPASP